MSERDELKERLFELGAAAGMATNEREMAAAREAFIKLFDQHMRDQAQAIMADLWRAPPSSLAAALNQHPDHD